jgi:hypothetical protein
VSADADPTPAEVMESLHAIFTGPVEGRDYHVMPENTAPVQDEDQPLAARGHSQDDNERHAMIPDAERGDDPRARIEIPRCGAPYRGFGTVALFAAGVTCPTCLTMLAEQLRGADEEDGS